MPATAGVRSAGQRRILFRSSRGLPLGRALVYEFPKSRELEAVMVTLLVSLAPFGL
jgi:hypothetical protein